MALLFSSGCQYITANTSGPGLVIPSNAPTQVTGRDGVSNHAMSVASNTGGRGFLYLTGSTATTFIVGFAYKRDASATVDQNVIICTSSNTSFTNPHWQAMINSGGQIFIRNAAGTTVGTTSTALTAATWYYIEIRAVIHDTTGAITLKVNGSTELTLTGLDTLNGSFTAMNFYGRDVASLVPMYWDDFYVVDETGSAPFNTYLGDVRIETLTPSSDNTAQFVGSDGNSTNNYLLVTDTSDATYVESGTDGNKDLYAANNLNNASTGTVLGINLHMRARTDSGTRLLVPLHKLSGTEAAGSNKSVTATETWFDQLFTTTPAGGNWALSDISSLLTGFKPAT